MTKDESDGRLRISRILRYVALTPTAVLFAITALQATDAGTRVNFGIGAAVAASIVVLQVVSDVSGTRFMDLKSPTATSKRILLIIAVALPIGVMLSVYELVAPSPALANLGSAVGGVAVAVFMVLMWYTLRTGHKSEPSTTGA